MSNSNSGITFENKIGMIEDAVIQQQSFITKILQSIQTFLQNDQNHQSNENLTTQFNQIVNDFQQQQKNFNFNTAQDRQLFSKIDLNDQMIKEHQIKLEDINFELKTVKSLLNNLKDGAPSDDDFEEYKNKIREIEEERAKKHIDPILKSIKCIKYEIKKMKENNTILQPQSDRNIERNEVTQPNLQSNDPVVSKIYSDLYKVRDDLKEDINALQEEAEPLLNEETRKFPGKLKTFKRELKQLKKIQEDIERTNSDLLERQEKIFAKLKQLRDEKINPLDEKVDRLQSSFDSLGENNKDLDRQDILSNQEELKGKIDELTAQINLLEGKAFEHNGLAQARDDLQSLKNAVDAGIPGNSSNSEEEDSDITSSNMLDALKGLKLQVSDLSIQNKRHDQCINQLLDSSNSLNNTFCENLDSRVQALEKQLADFNSLSSNIIQNSAPINEMNNSIKCLKFEVKRLKALKDENNDSNATQINEMRESIDDLKSEIERLKAMKDKDSDSTPKERGLNLTNSNDDSNSKKFDELENEIQDLKVELNDHIKELTDSFDTIKEKVANQIETPDNSSIIRDVQCMKYEIKRLKNKQSQNSQETGIPNSKIDAIESNLSDIKRELNTTIEEQLGQYNGKLQSLEDTMLSLASQLGNQKEQASQNTEKWPLIQVPAEKHEVNPLIGVLREKIHSLVDEMNQAPDQSEDVNKMKPSMKDTQNHLNKLQETLNTLLIQEEYKKVQLTPQLMWDEFCELKDRVALLEKGRHKSHSIKDRDVMIGDEDPEYDEFNYMKNDIKCIKYEIKKLKDGQTLASSSEELNLISQKIAELYGSQHQAIKVINSQSSQIQQHHSTISDQLSRIEDLESSIKQLDRNGQNLEEIDELTNQLNELKDKLLLIEEENEKFKGQINLLEDSSYAFLGPTTTSKKDRNPVIVMLEAQVSELLQQIEDPTLQEEPDETGELHPTMDQAEQDLLTVQKELRDLLEQEQADGKHEAVKAFNLVHKHMQNKINRLEKTILKQNETFKAVQLAYNDMELIKFRLNELSNSQQQVIRNVNMQNNLIDSTNHTLSRDVIPQLNDIHSQFDEHLDDHALLSTQLPGNSKDSVIKHTPNPVVESLREQINNLLVQMEHPDVKSTCENEKNENLKPSMDQLQKNLTILQDTLQKILNQQIYIPAEETLRGFQDQIYLLQEKYNKQTRELNELKRSSNDQLEDRINELEEKINLMKKQSIENINNQVYGEEIAKESDRITALEKELSKLQEALSKHKISTRDIEQPIMKATPEGHFIIKKTKRLNGTTNYNVQKLQSQIDQLTTRIKKAEQEEEDEEIDGDLHDHLGKTSDDLILLRQQLQRILEGYDVEEVVPISPQQMFDQLNDLLRRVDRLENSGSPQGFTTRSINLEASGEVGEKLQQLLASYNTFAQQINAHSSYLHQFKESIDDQMSRISDIETTLTELRDQLQDGAAVNELNESLKSVQDEVQRIKDQLELSDDYDVIEIEGGDADVMIDLEEDKNDNHRHHSNDLPSRVRNLEKRISELEKGSPNLQLREFLTSDGLPYSEAGFNEAASSSIYKSNPQVKEIQDQIDVLIKELNNSEFDSDEDDKTHIKKNVDETKKQLKVLQDALESLIRDDQQERIRLATLSPQKLLYKLDELNEEVSRMKEKLDENTNQIQDNSDDYNTLTNRVNELINAQNLLIQNSNAQNQKIKILTETVEDEDQKRRLDEIEEELRQHIENHDELISSNNNYLPVKTRGGVKPAHEHKQKELSPYIKGIQSQIDALLSNMNDLNEEQKQEEKQDKELDSRISETQTELLLLQKTLGSLQNFEVENEYENQEEEEDSNEPIASKLLKHLKSRGISLDNNNSEDMISKIKQLESKIDHLEGQISDHKISHLENQIKDLNNQLQNQPEQILSSLQLLWSKSPKGTSKYTAKKKPVNPVIKDIQDQIDVLVSKMNDPSMMDQDQDDAELAPQLQQTQDELARLQEILKTLMEGIEEEEEEDSENNEALYISPALVLSRLIKIEKEFMKNTEMKTAIHCLKHEVKHIKYQDSYLQTLRTRTEEITESQNHVIKAMQGMKSYITKNHDQELKEQILELTERVNLLENQPPFPIPISSNYDQISLNSMNSLPLSSSSKMIREIHRPRNVSPIIKEIQDQIDALVRKMNDPSIKKQKEKETLTPSFKKTQAQLAKLRATLKRLQEMEDVEYIEDDMNKVEDDGFFNVPGSYLSKQLLVENISYLNQKVNSVIIPSIKCIKHELKNLKQNGVSIKSRGIILDPQEEEEANDKLKTLENNYEKFMNRIEEITSAQNQVVFTLNQHKRLIDQANEKLDQVTDTIEDHIENGTDQNVMDRLQSIEQNFDDLQSNGFSQATRIPPKQKSKTREVNPVIQLLKEKIDELVEQMNDPGLKDNDEQTNNELNPSLNQAENEVLILREQLRKLLEEEEEEEPEIIVTPESLYRMIQENKEKLTLLEAMKVKDEIGSRLRDVEEKVDALNKRSEEFIDSHYKILQNNNANKSIVDNLKNKLSEQQTTINDNYEELENRVAALEEAQNNSPYSLWGQPVSRSIQLGKRQVNPALKKLNRQIGEFCDEINDPQIQAKDAEKLKPKFNKTETKLRTLQNTLTSIIGDDNDEDQFDEIITPDSLYQKILDLQDKVSSLEKSIEENNQNSIFTRSINLNSPSKKSSTRRKYNNPELENLKKKIDDLVQQMNDPSIERDETNSSSLKPEFAKAENELQILRDTLNALLEETEEEEDDEEYNIDKIPLTAETLPEIITNLRTKSINQEQSNTELRRIVQCLKHEVKKLKNNKNEGTTEEELMSYCDRLQQIAQRYDKHIVEAKNEMQRYREIKSQMKKENEVTSHLQRSIKCLKYEVKNLKFKRAHRSGHNGGPGGGGNNNDDGGFDNFNNDDDHGGDGSNRRHRSSSKSSGTTKGKSGSSGRSTRRSKTIEERVDIIEDSQEKAIQNMNSQRSYLEEFNKAIHQFSTQLNDHDQRIDDLEREKENNDNKIVNRSLPFDYVNDNEDNSDLESLEKRINEITGSQTTIVKCFNAQNQCINKIKEQIEEILSKQEDQIDEILSSKQNTDKDEDETQELINTLNNGLDEIRSSQALIVSNENKQNEALRQLYEKLNEVMTKQANDEERKIEEDETQRSLKCLKYEMKKIKNEINELSSSQKIVIDNSNSQSSYINKFNDIVNDLLMKQDELEKRIEDQDEKIQKLEEDNREKLDSKATLDDEYETKKLKENIRFIDERINQVTSSQKIITDNVNSQTGHIREIKEKLTELDTRQKEIEENKEDEEPTVIQTRDISLLSSDLETRIDELSSSHTTLVNTLNAQRSQIDQIKEKLDETMTNQKQIIEDTDTLIAESAENNNKKNLFQASNDQVLRIEKELTELQKNHLHLKSQFYDHLKEEENSNKLSKPLTDSINQLRESQNSAIKTINAQTSIIRTLENKISTLEANVNDLTNEIDNDDNKNEFDDSIIQNQLNSLEDRIDQITNSQNQAIQTINNQTSNLRRHETEINKLQKDIQSIQNEPSISSEEIIQIQDEIANLRDSNAYETDEVQNMKDDIQSLKDQIKTLNDQILSPLNNEISFLKNEVDELKTNQNQQNQQPVVVDRNLDLEDSTDSKIENINRSIKCLKYEVKKLLSLQSHYSNIEAEHAKIKSKVLKIDEFNKNQLVPHINQLEATAQKLREKTKKLTENDQKIVQHSEKMKQEIKQFNEIFNISPYLITTGDEQRKNNLRSFFESVSSTLNDHSSTLIQLEQRISNQENQQSQSMTPKSPKQNQKTFKDNESSNINDYSSCFVSTADFQKYTTNQNLLIEQLKKKISSSTKSTSPASNSNSNTLNNELSNIKREIDTIKNNLKNTMSYSDDVNIQNETQKVELLLSRIDKLEEQFASKIAEIDTKNTELDELRKYTTKLAKHVKSQEEKIKTIRDISNTK